MKKFSLYNQQDSRFVIGGLLLYHILVIGLCSFFCYKFLWLDFDPGVIILLVFFILATVWCDIKGAQLNVILRFLCRCSFDSTGIHCYAPFKRNWTIRWEDIHSFGIVGYNGTGKYKLVFLSTRSSDTWNNSFINITKEQIVFELKKEIWEAAVKYMPIDILGKLKKAQELQQDRFCRR